MAARAALAARIVAPFGLLAVVGCTASPLPPEAPPSVSPVELSTSKPRIAEHLFVVTDASGTMYDSGTFPRAKALSQGFVDALPRPGEPAASEVYNAGNIGFGGHQRVSLSLSSFDRAVLRASIDRIEVMGEVDGRGGSTPLHHVLREIAQQLEGRSGAAAIVLFSDGTADDPAAALAVASRLVRERGGRVCFHTVQLGDDAGGAFALRTLAELSSSCGSFRTADDLPNGRELVRFSRDVMTGP